jgi:DNA-binding CsgD family transcriptional regulator
MVLLSLYMVLHMPPDERKEIVRIAGSSSRRLPSRNRKLSDEDLELMKKMRLNGATIQEIAEYFGVNVKTVSDHLRAMGLRQRTRLIRCPEIPREALERLCWQGLTDEEIAKLFNTSEYCIARNRQKYNINKREIAATRIREKTYKNVETIANILSKYCYTTSTEISKMYGIHVTRNLLEIIEQSINGVKWFRLKYTSTSKYTVFSPRLANMVVIYLEGCEDKVLRFLKDLIVDNGVPKSSLVALLEMNNVPKNLIDKARLFSY